jgi:hypothetical protein
MLGQDGDPRVSKIPELAPGYADAVNAALQCREDVWGQVQLELPDGPSYHGISDLLAPVFGVDTTFQTESGAYYVPLTEPYDADSLALHVADGSQILSEAIDRWDPKISRPARIPGEVLSFTFSAGLTGTERFGSALSRLGEPALAEGHLPILLLSYSDADGTSYVRESFAIRLAGIESLVSFVRFTVRGGAANAAAIKVRIDDPAQPDDAAGLHHDGQRIHREERTYLLSEPAGNWADSELTIELDLQESAEHTVYLALWTTPGPGTFVLNAPTYDEARGHARDYWTGVMGEGACFSVPETIVMNAARSMLMQNLLMGRRYSVGNPYEMAFLMEAHESIEPLGRFGFGQRHAQELSGLIDDTNGPGPEWYESWERGFKLSAAVTHFYLTGDASIIEKRLDVYLGYLTDFERQQGSDPNGLLSPERYAWDIPDHIYGLHSQAVAWRGMRDMAQVLVDLGHHDSGKRFLDSAGALETALRKVALASGQDLDDGSLFIPVALRGSEQPHDFLPATRLGSYWNLVAPYALASGLFDFETDHAKRLLRYLDSHGAFFLGLTRFGGLYEPVQPIGEVAPDGTAGFKTTGIDNAWGVQALRFLAEMNQPDRIVLALYAKLAHGSTRGTFIDGEGTTLAPVPGEYFRTTWYSPNSTSNAFFLNAFRYTLVRETHDSVGRPATLDLAWATPRDWLANGKSVEVQDLPTEFGATSFRIKSAIAHGRVEVSVSLPDRREPSAVSLTLRLPKGFCVDRIEGSTRPNFSGETVNLTGLTGSLSFTAIVIAKDRLVLGQQQSSSKE